MPVHEIAARGFDTEAETYERSRPSYPPEAVAWLVENLRLHTGRTALDLAAGTGKLTRLLAPTGASLLAVEPVEGMWRMLGNALPRLPVAAATAEALPFAGESLDAVTVAQAFHWFDADRSFAELRRVMRPGARLGLVWNARDRSVEWVNETWSIMDRVERNAPWRNHDDWRDSALGNRAGFGALHAATFRHDQQLSPDGVIDRIRAVSHVAVLPFEQQESVLDQVRALLATHPDTRGRSELLIPYRVDAYWCERL